jgi:glycosyltransferase involved in cell wall biosynthesis
MTNNRRILVIPSWYPPDGGYFFREHSEALCRSGWQVDVLVNRLVGIRKLIHTGPSALRGFRIAKEGELRVFRSFYLKLPGCEKYNTGGWSRQTLRMYKRYEREYGSPALILAHSVTWAGYAAFLIRKACGIPYVIVEHRSFFVWSTREAMRMVRPFHIPFFEKAFTHCRKLVLVSDSLRKGVETLVPSAGKHIVVIPNMISPEMFLPPPETRKREPFVFIWAGRLEHVKGVDLLLEAVKLLSGTTTRKFSVRLAGKGPLREELEHQAVGLGIADRVSFLGRLTWTEMLGELQGANCFVLPSRYEAFGVVLIEAMATGLPVIATRSGGPDSILNPENGLLIAPENALQLSVAMERMMEHTEDYPETKIREQTLRKYGDIKVMEQYRQLFLHLIKE